jgi:hypothetical protein
VRLAAWLEGGENGGYVLSEGIQHGEDWAELPGRYHRGKAGIDFHVGIRPRGDDWYSEYFIIRTQATSEWSEKPVHLALSVEQGLAIAKDRVVEELPFLRGGGDQEMQPPVFVGIGKFNQAREWMAHPLLNRVPSMVRLERLQAVDVNRTNERQILVSGRGELLGLTRIGELDEGALFLEGLVPKMNKGELPHQVIQGLPKVLNSVPEDQWPLVADLYKAIDAIDNGPIFVVILPPKGDRNRLRVWGRGVLDNRGPKCIDMLFRPVKLGPRTRQVKASRHI